MAGMDWLRWHHGSVTDPKFQLVAKKAGASVAEVLAVWACLLEAASMAEDRGNPGEPDFDALDCALGLSDGKSASIYARMNDRALFSDDGRIASWDKRQPKREREDDKSTGRVQAFRQRKRDETPRNANETPETPRGEERRVEEITHPNGCVARATAGEACKAMKTAGMADVSPSHPKLIALLEAGITLPELADAAAHAVKSKKPFAYALATAEGRRRDSATASLPSASAPRNGSNKFTAAAAGIFPSQTKRQGEVIDV